jgi:hypothetical protein
LSKQGAHKNQTKGYIKHTDSIYKPANHKNQQSDYKSFGNILLLTVRFLDVAKFSALTPSLLLISCKIAFPIVGLKY